MARCQTISCRIQQVKDTACARPARPRLLYGSIFIWLSVVGGRFTAPFLEHEANFSDSQIGMVLSVGSLLSSFLGPSGGAFADAREQVIPNRGRIQVMLGGVTLGSCAFLLHGTCYLFPEVALYRSFGWHFALRLVYFCAGTLVLPVLDGVALAYLELEAGKDRSHYGQERLYGAIWWAVANLLLGPFLDRWGFPVMYGFAIIATMICFVSINWYAAGQNHTRKRYIDAMKLFPDENEDKRSLEQQDARQGESKIINTGNFVDNDTDIGAATKVPMSTLLRIMSGTVYGAAFLFFYYCLTAGTSVVESLIFLYFEYLQSTYVLCSITVVLTVVFEIPIFQMAPTLLRRYGAGTLQLVAGVAYVVRVIGYTLVPKGRMAFVLFLEPLHGVTYACSKTSSVEHVADLMPKGYEASGQGLLGLFGGLGTVTGLFLGGWAEDALGPRSMYRILAFTVLVGMTTFGIASVMRTTSLSPNEGIPKQTSFLPVRDDEIEREGLELTGNGIANGMESEKKWNGTGKEII